MYVGLSPFGYTYTFLVPREKLYPRLSQPLPPRCYTISAVGDSLERFRFSLCVGGRVSLPVPSRRPACSLLVRLPRSLFVSQLNNANNSLLLPQYPVPNCGCHANAVSYQEFVDDCVLVVETNSMTMRPRSHVNGWVDPIMFLNITRWSRGNRNIPRNSNIRTVEAESNFSIIAYFINWKFIHMRFHYNNSFIYY